MFVVAKYIFVFQLNGKVFVKVCACAVYFHVLQARVRMKESRITTHSLAL